MSNSTTKQIEKSFDAAWYDILDHVKASNFSGYELDKERKADEIIINIFNQWLEKNHVDPDTIDDLINQGKGA